MAAKSTGAPQGNDNAAKNKPWAYAIRRALMRPEGKDKAIALDRLAKALIREAEGGNIQAIKEIGDRIDGKAMQAMEVSGANGQPVIINATVVFKSVPNA